MNNTSTEKKEFDPEQSLQLIEHAIQQAKKRFEENGTLYMFWGTLVALASFSQFYLLHIGKATISWYPYLILPLGSVATMIMESKKQQKTFNPLGRITAAIWIFTGFNVMVLAFGFNGFLKESLPPIILILIGSATGVSGVLSRSSILFISGLFINSTGFVCFFLEWQYHPLVHGFVALLGLFLPGAILYFKQKKQHV